MCRLSNETHATAQRKQEQMEKLRQAFGLGEVGLLGRQSAIADWCGGGLALGLQCVQHVIRAGHCTCWGQHGSTNCRQQQVRFRPIAQST